MTPPILVGPLLQIFFTEYLVAQKRLSVQTIASYFPVKNSIVETPSEIDGTHEE